jgi:hypothetical protein
MENLSFNRSELSRAPRLQIFEFGPWRFNVNAAHAIITEHPRNATRLAVEDWARFYGLASSPGKVPLISPLELDRNYAMSTDLEEPVLVATMRNGKNDEFSLLIDGTHRLYKAHTQRVTELPAYVLDADESLAIREDNIFIEWTRLGASDRQNVPVKVERLAYDKE